MTSLSSQFLALQSLTSSHLTDLDTGFIKLKEAINSTEKRIISWDANDKVWLLAVVGGYLLGTFSGIFRWLIMGINISWRLTKEYASRGFYFSSAESRGVLSQ